MTNKELLDLIEQSKKGKQSAQTLLMNLFWNRIFYFILPKIKNETDTEDITIETFTKVFSKLKLYNQDFDFLTWVRSIAYNTMIDHTRKRPDLKISLDDELTNISIPETAPSPEQDLILQQNTKVLMKKIDALPPIYQKVIKLRYLDDKTYKEIAQTLSLTLANVKVRILRGRKLLEENLDSLE